MTGIKEWLMIPPECDHLTKLSNGREIDDLYSAEAQALDKLIDKVQRVVQYPGETIFVPSGWLHQVTNYG